jgi:predicted nucleic acid-binding protein
VGRLWVVNSSPLIVLGKVNRLPLLTDLAETVVVPDAVVREVARGPADDPAVRWLAGEGRTWVRDVGPVDPVVAAWDLGLGESHVLAWAAGNPGYEAIIDDLAARKCAHALRVPVRGVIGVLLLAKREGRIGRLAPVLDEVQAAGLLVGPEVLEAALRLASESEPD